MQADNFGVSAMTPLTSPEGLLAARQAKQIIHESPKEAPMLLEAEVVRYKKEEKVVCALEARRFQSFALMSNLSYDEARVKLGILREEANEAQEPRYTGIAEMYLGICSLEQGEANLAVEFFDQAIQIATELEDIDLIYKVQTNLAYAQMTMELYEAAIETLRLSIRHFESGGDFASNSTTLHNIAVSRVQITVRGKLQGDLTREQIEQARHDLEIAEAECSNDRHLSLLLKITRAVFASVVDGPDQGLVQLLKIKPWVGESSLTHSITFGIAETQVLELAQDWIALQSASLMLLETMRSSGWMANIQSVLKRAAHGFAMTRDFETAYSLLAEATEREGRPMNHPQAQVASLRLDLQRNKFDQEVLRMRNRTLIERNKILEQEARFDPLSGLLNRRGTEEALQQYTDRKFADRFAIALIDIDHFKKINDQFGHAIGDQVIQEFSACLASSSAKPSKLGRWGGEEFLIVFDIDNDAEMARVGQTLVEEIRALKWDHIHSGMKVTASCGLSMWKRGNSLDDAIRIADDMMYEVKHKGRNNWQAAA